MKHNIPTTTPNAQSNTQQNAESSRSKSYSKYEPLEGTPFTLVTINNTDNYDPLTDEEDIQHFLAMGDYRITEPTQTREETLEKLEKEKWMVIFTVAAVILEKMSGMKIKEMRDSMYADNSLAMNQAVEDHIEKQRWNQPLKGVDDNVTP